MNFDDYVPPFPFLAAFWVGAVAIAFLVGIYVAEFRKSPYHFFRDGFRAAERIIDELAGPKELLRTNLWNPTERSSTGVVRDEAAGRQPGYTLYTSGNFQGANLIDHSGEVVHRWRAEFRDVWSDPSHVAALVQPSYIYWRDAHLYPNGDVLALYIGFGASPWGYGLAKLDAQSNVLWTYDRKTHHDVHVADDGSIYTLVHKFRHLRDDPLEHFPELDLVVLEDFVVRLDPSGEVQARFSLLDAVDGSHYGKWVRNTFDNENWDPLHTNSVEPVSEDFAEHHGEIEPGDLLVSFRRPDIIAILDPDSETFQWATRGSWVAQHDADALANGNVLLFDNRGRGGAPDESLSRILELSFGPEGHSFEWSFGRNAEYSLESRIRSMQQKLSNGNVLVTESDGGRILEVTRDRRVVWEYHSGPFESLEDEKFAPVVSAAQRVPLSYYPF